MSPIDDVRALVLPVLRHRILIGYRAEAEGVTVEKVIDRLLESVSAATVSLRTRMNLRNVELAIQLGREKTTRRKQCAAGDSFSRSLRA